MFRLLFILFLVVPLVELYFLIKVANVISAGWTIFAVIATAVIGAGLLRMQGASTLLRAQTSLVKGQVPAMEMFEGILLALSGVLLLTPGLITDALGFLVLIPQVRQALIRSILKDQKMKMQQSNDRQDQPTVIEGEIVEEDEPKLR